MFSDPFLFFKSQSIKITSPFCILIALPVIAKSSVACPTIMKSHLADQMNDFH